MKSILLTTSTQAENCDCWEKQYCMVDKQTPDDSWAFGPGGAGCTVIGPNKSCNQYSQGPCIPMHSTVLAKIRKTWWFLLLQCSYNAHRPRSKYVHNLKHYWEHTLLQVKFYQRGQTCAHRRKNSDAPLPWGRVHAHKHTPQRDMYQ